ncbi:hypothetical protein SARC_11436, partial [Sphaeroforma arctica JP610]
MGKKDLPPTLLSMPLHEAGLISDPDVGLVPAPVQLTCDYLRKEGLESEGLFRKAGNSKRIDQLLSDISTYYLDREHSCVDNPERLMFDLLGQPLLSVHDVANALLRYLRNLPEPLLSNQYIPVICQSLEEYQLAVGENGGIFNLKEDAAEETLVDEKEEEALQLLLARMQYMITKMLPPANRATLNVVIDLCIALSNEQATNRMTPANIGVCIGMTVATPTVLQLIIQFNEIIIPKDESKKFAGAIGYQAIAGLDFTRTVESMPTFTLGSGSSATDQFCLGTLTFHGGMNSSYTMDKKERPSSWIGGGKQKDKDEKRVSTTAPRMGGTLEEKERK